MKPALQYMVDEKGYKTSVLVPLKTWEKINRQYTELRNEIKALNKIKVLASIKQGLAEAKSGKKLRTLKEFLRESKG